MPEDPRLSDRTKWIYTDENVLFNQTARKVQTFPVLDIPPQKTIAVGERWIVSLNPEFPQNLGKYRKVRFQIAEKIVEYDKMQVGMAAFYTYIIQYNVPFPERQLKVGINLVWYERLGDKLTFKRAVVKRLLSRKTPQDTKKLMVKIKLVDHNSSLIVKPKTLLFLYEEFAILPARAYKLKLEGMNFYKTTRIYNDIYLTNGSEIFSPLMDVVRMREGSKEVVLYTDWIRQRDFPYGVNEFILRRFVASDLLDPKFKAGEEIRCAGILSAKTNGEVLIQVYNNMYKHYASLMNREEIAKKTVGVRIPPVVGTIVLAPHQLSGGKYIRAEVLKVLATKKVQVRFLEYRDEVNIKLSEIILAETIHPYLAILPSMAVSACLASTAILDVDQFWQVIKKHEPYTIRTVRIRSNNKAAIEILQYKVHRTNFNLSILKLNNLTLNMESVAASMGRYHLNFQTDEAGRFRNCRNAFVHHDVILGDGLGSECQVLRAGSKVTFNISRIIDAYTHLIALSYYEPNHKHSRDEMEDSMMEDFNEMGEASTPHRNAFERGNFFMIRSSTLFATVRGVMVGLSQTLDIDVFLIDYGIVEAVRWADCRELNPIRDTRLTAYGVLATVVNTEEYPIEKLMEIERDEYLIYAKILSVQIFNLIPYVEVEIVKEYCSYLQKQDEEQEFDDSELRYHAPVEPPQQTSSTSTDSSIVI